jgi:hypothetical protein
MTPRLMKAGRTQRILILLLAIPSVLALNVRTESVLAPTVRKRDAQAPDVTTASVSMIRASILVVLAVTVAWMDPVTVLIAKQ